MIAAVTLPVLSITRSLTLPLCVGRIINSRLIDIGGEPLARRERGLCETRAASEARTEADTASVFNINDFLCSCGTPVIRERYGLIMVSFGNAKPDKRVTDPVSSSSNRIAPITCRSFVMRRARLSKMPTLNLSDLRGEPFIVRARCDRYHDVSDALDSRGITLNVMYKTDQDDRALALVAAGVGLALFPAHFEMPTVKKVRCQIWASLDRLVSFGCANERTTLRNS